jgi:pSer/pThr/pTyr-binding forkhead associated (FHA) protein
MRASDREREATIRHLHDGRVDGRLSTETFEARIERALTAKSGGELRELTADVSRVSRLRAWLAGALRAEPDAVTSLWLRAVGERPFVVGRSRQADFVVGEDTVSRLHAQIVRTPDGFVLTDLGSTNGTWLAGRRVGQVEVAAGDVVRLGDLSLRLR